MIHVKISNRGKEDRIRFPCTEGELSRKLEEIGAYGAQEAPHFYIEKGNRPQRVCRFGRAVCRPGCVKLSGNQARVCDYDWVLGLKKQCEQADVSFYFKQTGARLKKDGKLYRIARQHQHAQARKAGINYWREGRET